MDLYTALQPDSSPSTQIKALETDSESKEVHLDVIMWLPNWLGRAIRGFKRLVCSATREENQAGIRAYLNGLKAVSQKMYDRASLSLAGLSNEGKALTFRRVREIAVQEWCTKKFIDTNIRVGNYYLSLLHEPFTKKQEALEKEKKALEMLQAHFDLRSSEANSPEVDGIKQYIKDLIQENTQKVSKLEAIEEERQKSRKRNDEQLIKKPFDFKF